MPAKFEDVRVENLFLRQYRVSGVHFAKIAFLIGAAVTLIFIVLLAVAAIETQVSGARQGTRAGLLVLLLTTAVFLHYRIETAIQYFHWSVGVPTAIASIVVGTLGLLPTDTGAVSANRFAVATCLTCWLCFGFTRLTAPFVLAICCISSFLTFMGAYLQQDDHILAIAIYLGVANLIGWLMSVEIERRERTLFWKSRQLTQATHALELMAKQAAEANAAKTGVMAAVSHDLRQPISSLSLYIQLLQTRNAESVAIGQEGLLQKANACVEVLSSNLGRLAELSGLQGERTPIELRQVDLRDVLERLEHVYAVEAYRRNVHLRFRMPPQATLMVRSNEGRLWDVLSNLVGNALKFGSPKRAPWVLVRTRRIGDSVAVAVCDNGLGIDRSDQDRIFEEHYQVDNAERNRERGYGLGLSIVREMIGRLPGHSIRLRSARDAGACFSVYMPAANLSDIRDPLVADDERLAAVDRSPAVLPGSAPSLMATDALAVSEVLKRYACLSAQESERVLASVYVLLVEDDASVRDALSLVLERWGVLVEAVPQASEALWFVENGERLFDAIISDYRLPGQFDGLRLIGEARRLAGEPIPSVLISAELNAQMLREQAPDGVVVLSKPLDTHVLRGVLIALTRRPLGWPDLMT